MKLGKANKKTISSVATDSTALGRISAAKEDN
jgi:hypothetical protein